MLNFFLHKSTEESGTRSGSGQRESESANSVLKQSFLRCLLPARCRLLRIADDYGLIRHVDLLVTATCCIGTGVSQSARKLGATRLLPFVPIRSASRTRCYNCCPRCYSSFPCCYTCFPRCSSGCGCPRRCNCPAFFPLVNTSAVKGGKTSL